MAELIQLNPTEQFLQNANVSMTLKDIADKYNIEHKNATRDFKKMVTSLEDIELDTLTFELTSYTDSSNRTQQTFKLDLKTMLWFMTKFDHSLRLQVINYAFEKLDKEKELAILEARKPKVYPDGRMSVRRAITEIWDDTDIDVPNETDIWNALIFKGFAETKAKVTVMRTIPENVEGFVGVSKTRGFATYEPKLIKRAWDEFKSEGKPIKPEYERLQEEFTQISEHYKEKMAKAKK